TAGQPQVFLDPNQLSTNGTAAIGSYGFSKSGKYFYYTTFQLRVCFLCARFELEPDFEGRTAMGHLLLGQRTDGP
ncbi:MAG: hypothetical protein ACKPB4_25150, partial [Sphaerospermopsis kisseleviana]